MAYYPVLVLGIILTLSFPPANGEAEVRSTPVAEVAPSAGLSTSTHNLNSGTYFPKPNEAIPKILHYFNKALLVYRKRPCINLGDEGCVNGYIPGAGSDGGYLNGGHNPGK